MSAKSSPERPRPTTVKRGSVTLKIYRGTTHGYPTFTLAYYEAGKRVRKSFPSLAQAKTAGEIIATRIENADAGALELTGADRQQYLLASNELREIGVPLHLAVREFVAAKRIAGEASLLEAAKYHRSHTDPSRPRKMVREAVEECLAAKAGDGLSERYLVQLRSDLLRFSHDFQKQIAEVTGAEIDDWLRGLRHNGASVAGRTRNNLRTSIATLFSYAKQRAYLPQNVPTQAESVAKAKVTEAETQILTPAQMKRILTHATGDVLAHLTIAGFAMVRTEEVERLQWEHINLKTGVITVNAVHAKVSRRRLVPVSQNLKAWLRPLQSSGPVLKENEVFKEVTHLARSLGIEWVKNFLRNSAISYRIAVTQNVAQVAYEAGTSPRVIFTNYRQLATPAQGRTWFSIQP